MGPNDPFNYGANSLVCHSVFSRETSHGNASSVSSPDLKNVRFRKFRHPMARSARSAFRERVSPVSVATSYQMGLFTCPMVVAPLQRFRMPTSPMRIASRGRPVTLAIIGVVLNGSAGKMQRINTKRISANHMANDWTRMERSTMYCMGKAMSPHGDSAHGKLAVSIGRFKPSPYPTKIRLVDPQPKPFLVLLRDCCDFCVSHFTSSFRDLISAFRALKTLAMHAQFNQMARAINPI